MIAFKKRAQAVRLCNFVNTLPGMRMMVVAVPAGFIVTKSKGIKEHG